MGALVRRTRGVDGADRLLLEAAEPADVARRFARVVVGSGDHIFTELVIELDRRSVDVAVVSRPEALAGRLRVAVRLSACCRPWTLLNKAKLAWWSGSKMRS